MTSSNLSSEKLRERTKISISGWKILKLRLIFSFSP